jgi:phage terminase large subunit
MEEANEFDPSDYPFLLTRLSEGDRGRIYLLYNPEECWIQDLEGKPNVQFFFSSYLDNPFLSDDYREALESLKDQDDAMYRIFCLGQRAKKGTLVYPNWAMVDSFPGTPEVYGLDFGFSNPSALVGVRIEELDLYARELVYKEKLTNAQLMDACKDAIGDGWGSAEIYADSEAPDKVQEFYDNGFSGIKGYEKKKGSVKVRLDYVKRHRVLIPKDSPNLIKEIKRYSHKLDKNGKPMEEPVKFMDHGMDALGYAAHGAAQSIGDYDLIQVV